MLITVVLKFLVVQQTAKNNHEKSNLLSQSTKIINIHIWRVMLFWVTNLLVYQQIISPVDYVELSKGIQQTHWA